MQDTDSIACLTAHRLTLNSTMPDLMTTGKLQPDTETPVQQLSATWSQFALGNITLLKFQTSRTSDAVDCYA